MPAHTLKGTSAGIQTSSPRRRGTNSFIPGFPPPDFSRAGFAGMTILLFLCGYANVSIYFDIDNLPLHQ